MTAEEPKPAITVLADDRGAEAVWIADELGAHIADAFAPANARPLVIAARDGAGALIGGLSGLSHWRWLYIRQLYVAPAARGAGLGRALMTQAEALARERGCIGLYVDTFSAKTAAFYRSLRFEPVGSIADFPPGSARIFLARRLEAADAPPSAD